MQPPGGHTSFSFNDGSDSRSDGRRGAPPQPAPEQHYATQPPGGHTSFSFNDGSDSRSDGRRAMNPPPPAHDGRRDDGRRGSAQPPPPDEALADFVASQSRPRWRCGSNPAPASLATLACGGAAAHTQPLPPLPRSPEPPLPPLPRRIFPDPRFDGYPPPQLLRRRGAGPACPRPPTAVHASEPAQGESDLRWRLRRGRAAR